VCLAWLDLLLVVLFCNSETDLFLLFKDCIEFLLAGIGGKINVISFISRVGVLVQTTAELWEKRL